MSNFFLSVIGANGKVASPVGIHYSGIWVTDWFSNPEQNHTVTSLSGLDFLKREYGLFYGPIA